MIYILSFNLCKYCKLTPTFLFAFFPLNMYDTLPNTIGAQPQRQSTPLHCWCNREARCWLLTYIPTRYAPAYKTIDERCDLSHRYEGPETFIRRGGVFCQEGVRPIWLYWAQEITLTIFNTHFPIFAPQLMHMCCWCWPSEQPQNSFQEIIMWSSFLWPSFVTRMSPPSMF